MRFQYLVARPRRISPRVRAHIQEVPWSCLALRKPARRRAACGSAQRRSPWTGRSTRVRGSVNLGSGVNPNSGILEVNPNSGFPDVHPLRPPFGIYLCGSARKRIPWTGRSTRVRGSVRRETGHTHKHTTRTTPHNKRHDQVTHKHTTRTTPHNKRHDKNNTTNDHTKDHPPALNNDRRWSGDGAYHLPHPGGWPRRSQRGRKGRSPTRPGAR